MRRLAPLALAAAIALLPASGAIHAAPEPPPKAAPSQWAPGVYHLGNLIPLEADIPIPSASFYLEGDLTEGADWGEARIATIRQHPPETFPGILRLDLTVQLFATGTVSLPPARVAVHLPGSVLLYSVAPPPISIAPLLPPGRQPQPPPRPPLPAPLPFPWIWAVLALLAAALAFAGALLWRRRLRRRPKCPEQKPSLRETDPERWIRQEMERLRASALPPDARYAQVSQLLREYLELRFGLPFLEWTTSEVRANCTRAGQLQGSAAEDLLSVLLFSDRACFARYRPEEEEEAQAWIRIHRLLEAVARPRPLEKAS
jgi:hypothetical protein